MVAVQFACPHCTGMFLVENLASGQQMACPHCRGLLAIPAMAAPGAVSPLSPVSPALTPRQDYASRPFPVSAPQPGGAGAAASAGNRRPARPLPLASVAAAPAPLQSLPVAAGAAARIVVRDPVRTAGCGSEAVELRSVSPEERARRRLKKNLVLWGFGLLLIGITLALVLSMGPL